VHVKVDDFSEVPKPPDVRLGLAAIERAVGDEADAHSE
jgi:hypothetical protein